MRKLNLLTVILAALPVVTNAQVPAARKSAVAASAATASRPAKTATATAATKTAKAPTGGVPAHAVQVDEFTWRANDEKGVAWIYRKTPFGFSKAREEDLNKPVAPLTAPDDVRVTHDANGKLKFERSGPWGTQVWTKAANELTDDEKQWAAKGQEAAKK